MTTVSEDSPGGRVASNQGAVEHLLGLALDISGAERAYVVSAAETARGAGHRVEWFRSARDDGNDRPSSTVVTRALETRSPFICLDAAEDRRLAPGRSVRGLSLRCVVSAPIPVTNGFRGALVLDSRLAPGMPPSGLRRLVEAFAALVGMSMDRRSPRGGGSTPAARAPAEPRGDDDARSSAYRSMLDWVRRVAPSELPVLIRGETGSGKEGVARSVHRQSRRACGPFMAVNCAALPETLLEAELFGTTRGAYTGAERDRAGLFQLAQGGTLFLDEVGDMPEVMQVKLLRALEERRARAVGGTDELPIDVRVVTATHHDVALRARTGQFRADLYFRLAVVEIVVPALRERLEDLPLLVASLSHRLEHETGHVLRLAPPVWDVLAGYGWPGNVRELHAILARALLQSGGQRIEMDHVTPLLRSVDPRMPRAGGGALEARMIRQALLDVNGNLTQAAGNIGWSRQKLYRRLGALGISEATGRRR